VINAGFHVALAVVIRYKTTGVPGRFIELAEGEETCSGRSRA